MQYLNSREFARELDKSDPLVSFRDLFHFPCVQDKTLIYLCGNSLGLQPKSAQSYIEAELVTWREKGVEGHFAPERPWFSYHKLLKPGLAMLTGANPDEVTAMNNLTTNLHLMLVSFYRPTPKKFKIITEAGGFPSDQYALESQAKYHGFDPEEAIIELKPRQGEFTLRTEDILSAIEYHQQELALVMMSGVHYFTGQYFDIAAITRAAHKAQAYAGFDLAHAIGNVPLKLHDWEVDFAVWCTYKYLNAGPGGTAGAFVHRKHGQSADLPRFAGWWGHQEKERFKMQKGFTPSQGIDGWQHSNVNILSLAAQRAALDIFLKTDINTLRKKSLLLTGFLEFLVTKLNTPNIQIITPSDPEQRGAQLSLQIAANGKKVFEALRQHHIIVDWREPDVIRVSPAPLYNTFTEIHSFYLTIKEILQKYAY
jgi:kynureninase